MFDRSRRAASFRRRAEEFDGLILLGAGEYGIVSGNLMPALGAELRLTNDFLARNLPVVGIGIGACILTARQAGAPRKAPLRLIVEKARRDDRGRA